ncbi:Com family DNA-binding transcriptional regulator [Rivihabitans pingtungensis]|uniref:Com family DNA-binding transcriptional regulator n=1 Tax=Rivihabitans pingtungensis TaxID=1054498 RepID=UPI000D760706|nr:Com family DNA-binding transcriptional regulator [Rivihabitans pingtungensis]
MQQNDIRCGNCRRKLGEGVYLSLTIKCPRCGCINHLRAESPNHTERHERLALEALSETIAHHPVAGRQTPSGPPHPTPVPRSHLLR